MLGSNIPLVETSKLSSLVLSKKELVDLFGWSPKGYQEGLLKGNKNVYCASNGNMWKLYKQIKKPPVKEPLP